MQTIINLIVFILVLGVIILVHELGHFIAAKAFGVYCSEFSIGMGPSLWHSQKGETAYHIRALPIGGYVAMAGEVDQEENEEMKDVPFERTIKGIKTWKQVVVMSAGVFMNFVLAIVLLIGVYTFSASVSTNENIIGNVLEEGVAYQAGIEVGDEITQMTFPANGETFSISSMSDITAALRVENNHVEAAETEIEIGLMRDGAPQTVTLVALYDESREAFYLGIQPTARSLTLTESISYTFQDVAEMSTLIFQTLGRLITDSRNTISQLSGPAGIYQVTSQVTSQGDIATLIALVATLSINVGIFNLMPIPGLDGSQILFALVEKALGRPIPTRLRYYLQLAGLVLVFGLMIVVTIQDFSRIF